ncbi:zinc finger, CCHC-type containing protein [Tanacetum coccineum]
MKEEETIDIFTTKLTTLVNKAASLGHTMEDEKLVRKPLNAVPDRYLQIVASIEQYSYLDEMTLEEAIGRLKTYEERIKYKKGKQVDNQEKLMFTRHKNKGNYFRGRGRGRHKFSQGRNHENFKKERKDGETSHRSYDKNKLNGSIPSSLCGVVPLDLGSLGELSWLDLSINKLNGSIPSSLGDCSKLINLNLSSNKLSHDIPAQIGRLLHLSSLDLSQNSLTGEIPSALSSLSKEDIHCKNSKIRRWK